MNTVEMAAAKVEIVNALVANQDKFLQPLNMERVLYPDDFFMDNVVQIGQVGALLNADTTPFGELVYRLVKYIDYYQNARIVFKRVARAVKEV